jgi:hypothetical protein
MSPVDHLQPSCAVPTDGSLSADSFRAERMPMTAESGQQRTHAVHTWCFIVESGFGWNDGPTGRLNFCGQTFPLFDQVPTGLSANNGIRELWWNGWQ